MLNKTYSFPFNINQSKKHINRLPKCNSRSKKKFKKKGKISRVDIYKFLDQFSNNRQLSDIIYQEINKVIFSNANNGRETIFILLSVFLSPMLIRQERKKKLRTVYIHMFVTFLYTFICPMPYYCPHSNRRNHNFILPYTLYSIIIKQ